MQRGIPGSGTQPELHNSPSPNLPFQSTNRIYRNSNSNTSYSSWKLHSQKRGGGHPPWSGKKHQLASLGELLSASAGMGFTTHTITVAIGENIAAKIMAFTHQGPRNRAVCILLANGAVSTVTLRQSSNSCGTITYEGRFGILSLSGSFLPTGNGLSGHRTGSLNVLLNSPDGRDIGGQVGGVLIAASQVQVILGTFMCAESKTMTKGRVRKRRRDGVRSSGSS